MPPNKGAARPPNGLAVFDPRAGLATAHLDTLSLMEMDGMDGTAMGVVGGGSSGVAAGRVLVAEAKLVRGGQQVSWRVW